MKKLKLSFDAKDKTGRGSIFVFRGKTTETYLRALVENSSNENLGAARLFLTRVERVARGKRTLITSDPLPLNWALMSGADVSFFPGYRHYADILTFASGAKHFTPMVTRRSPSYWPHELSLPGEYHLHLLLTGENTLPTRAVLKVQWPMKNTASCRFQVSK